MSQALISKRLQGFSPYLCKSTPFPWSDLYCHSLSETIWLSVVLFLSLHANVSCYMVTVCYNQLWLHVRYYVCTMRQSHPHRHIWLMNARSVLIFALPCFAWDDHIIVYGCSLFPCSDQSPCIVYLYGSPLHFLYNSKNKYFSNLSFVSHLFCSTQYDVFFCCFVNTRINNIECFRQQGECADIKEFDIRNMLQLEPNHALFKLPGHHVRPWVNMNEIHDTLLKLFPSMSIAAWNQSFCYLWQIINIASLVGPNVS